MRGRNVSLPAVAFSIASFAFVIGNWEKLPDPYPTHWNWRGVVDGWTPKPWGPLILPATVALVAVICFVCAAYAKEKRTARIIKIFAAVISAAMMAMTIVTTLAAMGHAVDMTLAIPLIIGSLFVALGNYFGKLPRNRFAGIRTPWTLGSDEVWYRTHRFGGKIFVLGGVVSIAGALLGHGMEALIATVLFTTIASVSYSYFIHQRIARR